MVGNSIDTGIDIKPEVSGNGVTLDTTTITFTYPFSVGDVVTVAYKTERLPASLTYSPMEFLLFRILQIGLRSDTRFI